MATTNGAEGISVDINEIRREALAKAEEIRKEAAKKLNAAAESIRKDVRQHDADKEAVEKADEVAKHLEDTARYLGSHTLEDMGEEAVKVVQKYPWRTLAVVLVIGMIIGLLLRRK